MRKAALLLALALVSSGLVTARPAAADDIEQRIASFWQRVNALGPSDLLAAADLGQWALNVIQRDPGAGITVVDFRSSTAAMQAAFDRAGVGVPPGAPKSPDVEDRIARFWQKVDALGPNGLLTATDLGQWALNVTDRDPNKRIRVDDFRASTVGMQGGLDRARSLPRPATPTPTPRPSPTPTPSPSASIVTAGPSPTPVAATPTAPPPSVKPTATPTPATTVTTGGFTFSVRATATSDVYVDQTISTADAQTIATTVDADVSSVQTTYGRAYTTRPPIYVFPATSTYTTGLQTVLGLSASVAAIDGSQTTGIFRSRITGGVKEVKVALNWEKVKAQKPMTTARHELTHMMIDQIAKETSANPLPAWINEGSARQQEFTVAGTRYWSMRNRYTAASMVAVRNSFSVADLASQDTWNARTGDAGISQYYEASEIVQLLRDDVGVAGVTRIFELMGSGQAFDAAFQAVTAKTVATFASAVPTRLQAIAQSYPGIATAPDEPGGAGLSYILYGFAPNSTVNVDILGLSNGFENTTKTWTVDAYGVRSSYFGSGWPADSYSITATGLTPSSSTQPNTTVTVRITAAKSASFEGLSLTW